MHIEPTYTSVGKLFEYKPMFFIPKYQRAYAWDTEQISDFVKDLIKCIEMRKSGLNLQHFFGGILSVKHSIPGAVSQLKYEIIDGQQRIATFTILIASIIECYDKLKQDAVAEGDRENASIIEERIESLSKRFVQFDQEIQRKKETIEVLTLSRADHPYYFELIRNMNPDPSRDSHRRMYAAFKCLSDMINDIVDAHGDIEAKIDELEVIQFVIDDDFSVLHMVTESRKDAFRLFQVINDRGTNLTDGDLLRSRTLEMLEGYQPEQDSVEQAWDNMLSDPPSNTNNYLNWIYESYEGKRSKQNILFDMFLDKFFPQHQLDRLTQHYAEDVRTSVQNVKEDILKCRQLIEGNWLYAPQQPVTSWDITRLNILLVELGHTLSIPLFLAASRLDQKYFSEIVQIVERIFFRYKLICNRHVTPLKNIYYEECTAIRQDPANYNVESLKNKLQNLINEKASDQTFKNDLLKLEYKVTGGSNKPLKYFLMTIEYYYQWVKDGAAGKPECLDKMRVFDFSGTSIEHVYPRNAAGALIDHNLEPLKNTLGNLTIMDPSQNTLGGNESFINKKGIYQASSVVLTQEISRLADWTEATITAHRDFLLDAAALIFRT